MERRNARIGWGRLLGGVFLGVSILGCAPEPPLHRANLVVVVADALRADHLGIYGWSSEPRTSPFIDAWARDGVRFEDVTATSSQTVPATLSLLTGAYPRDHGNQYYPRSNSFRAPVPKTRPRIAAERGLLAEVLQQAGFRTGAIVANPWLRAEYGFARGFEVYREFEKPNRRAYVRGDVLLEEARTFLEGTRGERFFLYLHFMDVHSPYRPPREYRQAFVGDQPGLHVNGNGPMPALAPENVEHTRRLYAAEVRGFDDRFRELTELLAAFELTESTVVVLVSDHGDEFHEHGGMGHGWTLFEEVVQVPWVLVHPSLRERPETIAAPVSGVDVAPTLLDLLGVDAALGNGRSLAGAVLGGDVPAEEPRFSELAVQKSIREGDRKVVTDADGRVLHAFDLGQDAHEAIGAERDAPWVASLGERLVQWRRAARLDEVSSGDDPVTPDPALEQQLRELGYIETPEPSPERP